MKVAEFLVPQILEYPSYLLLYHKRKRDNKLSTLWVELYTDNKMSLSQRYGSLDALYVSYFEKVQCTLKRF